MKDTRRCRLTEWRAELTWEEPAQWRQLATVSSVTLQIVSYSSTASGEMCLRNDRERPLAWIIDETTPPNKTGKKPALMLLAAIAIVPLLAVAGWFVFG
jgi:hypothetical protein